MKIGFAISVYDKVEDVEILVDIIREHFSDDYYICVATDNEDTRKKLESKKIDKLVEASGIPYTPSMDMPRKRINRTSRILESIRRSILGCEPHCDYVMHLHADAWPLDESKLKALVEEMKDKNKSIAARGPGYSYRKTHFWSGKLMDQFLVLDVENTSNLDLLDFNPLDLMPHGGIHNSLMMLLLGRVQRSNILVYSDMSEDLLWENREQFRPLTRPSMINEKLGFVHIATDDFPDLKGKELQAHYLQKFNVEGTNVNQFLEEYYSENIIEDLEKLRSQYRRKMLKLGYTTKEELGEGFKFKKDIIHDPLNEKLLRLSKNIFRTIYFNIHQFMFRIKLFKKILPGEYERFRRDPRIYDVYPDSEWPENQLKKIYSEEVELSDYEDKFDRFWFLDS